MAGVLVEKSLIGQYSGGYLGTSVGTYVLTLNYPPGYPPRDLTSSHSGVPWILYLRRIGGYRVYFTTAFFLLSLFLFPPCQRSSNIYNGHTYILAVPHFIQSWVQHWKMYSAPAFWNFSFRKFVTDTTCHDASTFSEHKGSIQDWSLLSLHVLGLLISPNLSPPIPTLLVPLPESTLRDCDSLKPEMQEIEY